MSNAVKYPGATWQDRTQFSGIKMLKLEKVCWHTTETAGWPGYPTFAPQLTVDPIKKQIRQHMDVNMSATTLADPSSTAVRENRDNVVQIEVVAYCDPKKVSSPYYFGKWGDEEYRFLAELAAWFYTEWDVPLESSVEWITYPASYGRNAKQRLSSAEYDAYRGQLGHQHASGNDHGDPSNIDMERLLRFARELVNEPPPDDKPVPLPYAPGQVLPGGSITTPFGKKGDWEAGFHTGDDWNVGDPGEDYWFPLYATKPGKVVYVGTEGWGPAYGRQVHVKYDNGRIGMFAHLAAYSVKTGDTVKPGTQVGRVGYSGNVIPAPKPGAEADGSHCHYEERISPYRYGRDAVKPVYIVEEWKWDGKAFPGSERLQIDDEGPWVTLLGKRLVKWGYTGYAEGPGPVMGVKDVEGGAWLRKKLGWTGTNIDQKLWDLLLTDPPDEPEKPVDVVYVGTCNIYVGNSIANGKKAIDIFRTAGADAVGWQELSEDSDQKALTAYAESVGWGATKKNSAVTIFYNAKTQKLIREFYEVVEKGGRPWEPGAGGDDSIHKIILSVELEDKASGKRWFLHNNHINPTIEKAGEWRDNPIRVSIAKRQFLRLAENLKETSTGGKMSAATGDMNVGWGDGPASDWCERVFDAVGATVCWDEFRDEPTHGGVNGRTIDWIICKNGKYKDIKVVNIPGSDHEGVVVGIEI